MEEAVTGAEEEDGSYVEDNDSDVDEDAVGAAEDGNADEGDADEDTGADADDGGADDDNVEVDTVDVDSVDVDKTEDETLLVMDADSTELDKVIEGPAELVITINVGSAETDIDELVIDDAGGGVEASKHF